MMCRRDNLTRVLFYVFLLGTSLCQISMEMKHVLIEPMPFTDDDTWEEGTRKPGENYRPSDYLTISVGKNQNITLTEEVKEVIDGKTYATIVFHCLTRDFNVCKIYFQVIDSLGNEVYNEHAAEAGSFKLTFLIGGEYRFSFINRDKAEKQISVGLECFHCGKEYSFNNQFLNKDFIKEKLDRIGQLRRMIGAMMLLTTNTKKVVATFTASSFRLHRHSKR